MKALTLLIFVFTSVLPQASFGQTFQQKFVTEDIANFWTAHDKISSTKDSAQQYGALREHYLSKGTEGLRRLMEVRRYTEKDFVEAINNYPRFWASIRGSTRSLRSLQTEIEANISKLKDLYPQLKPSTIYFSMGAFRTAGTAQGNRVLIGSEMAFGDSSTITDELPTSLQAFFREYQPRKNLAFTCTHEYVHTQQKAVVENLLPMCLYEGVAEFVAGLVTGKAPPGTAFGFGEANRDKVLKRFVADLFTMTNNANWLWGENRNEFGVRDLGYYIGYKICERYYNASADKAAAIRELIELDYTDEQAVERIVNSTRLLPKPLAALERDYEKGRPKVVSLQPFKNGSKRVQPGLVKITVAFSEPLNGYNTGIDFGPLGEGVIPKISRERTRARNAKSWTFEAALEPNRRYQILISNNFRTVDGVRLKPYLIDITTTQ